MHFFKHYHRFVKIFVGSLDFSITDLTLNLLFPSIVMLFLYFFLLHIEYYPATIQNFCEMIYEGAYSFIEEQVGPKAKGCEHVLMALMFFIILLNLSNLFPWSYGATSQFGVNISLAFIVFCVVFFFGIKKYGIHVWKHFVLDIPLAMKPFLFVLELFSFCIRPLTLAVRLSMNVLVGHLILQILSEMSLGVPGLKILTLAFSIGFCIFEMLVSFLQAYIFIILSCVYIAEMSDGH